MFPDHTESLLRQAGLPDFLTSAPLLAYQDSEGTAHASNLCHRAGQGVNLVRVAPASLRSCYCFDRDTSLFASEVARLMDLSKDYQTWMQDIQGAERLTEHSSAEDVHTFYCALTSHPLKNRDASLIPTQVQKLFHAKQEYTSTTVLPRLAMLATAALELSYVLTSVKETLTTYYVKGRHPYKQTVRTLLNLWEEMVISGESITQRRRKILAAVGELSHDWGQDPRLVGSRAKLWLRDAERLLGESLRPADTAQPLRLAVYGARWKDSRLELQLFELRARNGSVLVAIPDRARHALGKLGVNPARCSNRLLSDPVTLELATSLWDPSLREMFNDLDVLADAAEALAVA